MTFKNVFDFLGDVGTLVAIFTATLAVLLWFWGIVPVLYRLGNGLSRRTIAIFAKGDALRSLERLISDAKIFNGNGCIGIATDDDLRNCEGATLFVVHWADWKEHIEEILAQKKVGTAVVVYAEPGAIPPEIMKMIANQPNTAVCNFRGRLLNDVLTSMMTTS